MSMIQFSFIIGSRYGQPRNVVLVDEEKGTFLVSGPSRYFRRSEEMYDFSGGPCIWVGEDFYGLGTVRGLLSPEDHQHKEGHASVIVSVELSKKGIKRIRKHKEERHGGTEALGGAAVGRQGGEGLPDPAAWGGGDLPLGEGRGAGGEVAQRLPQEDRVGDVVPPDPVEGFGGTAGGGHGPRVRRRNLVGEIRYSKDQWRIDVEKDYPRVFGSCGTRSVDTDQPDRTSRWKFGYGWDGLVTHLVMLIDRELRNDPSQGEFCIELMKEKFSCLRVYSRGGNERIRALIDMKETESSRICEVCGDFGHLHRSEGGRGGWLKTFCHDCGLYFGYSGVIEEDK